MPLSLAHNRRTSSAAIIKRASAAGRRDMNRLDRRSLEQLDRLYRQAAAQLEASIRSYAGTDGSLRLEAMQDLLRQVNGTLQDLSVSRNQLLDLQMIKAAEQGVRPYASVASDLTRVSNDALRFSRNFVANDGLQLSDRLWRLDRGARERVEEAVQSAIIQGHSASEAANDFLSDGEPVPPDIRNKLGISNADAVARTTGRTLLFNEGNARESAMRVFRTELNRAHGEAYRAAAFDVDGVVGTRYLLSPNHPKVDICDMHSSVNRHGLGPGVYPKGKSPWPAHPNTLSYEEAVFEDEVTDADRAGKENRIDWLKRQTPEIQQGALGSRMKRAALLRGILKENEISTPWNVLKNRYIRRGLDPSQWVNQPIQGTPPVGTAQARRWASSFSGSDPQILDVVNAHPPPREIPSKGGHGAYHLRGGIMMGTGNKPNTPDGRRSWRHEYGHYIDYRLRGTSPGYASNSAAGHAALEADATLWSRRRVAVYKRILASSELLQVVNKGKRYSHSRYHQARRRAQLDVIDELREEIKKDNPSFDRAEIASEVPVRIRQHFEGRDDIWGLAWSHGNERWWRNNAEGLYTAERFDDLGYLADNPPHGHESAINMGDLVGSITLNKNGAGHTLEYYRQASHRQTAEAFANSFDLMSYGADGYEEQVLDQFAPEFSKFARRLLNGS